MSGALRLGVNIDHVATIRNARGGDHPDPVRAAFAAAASGADGITAHLREDRRHITDEDIDRLIDRLQIPLNLEMAATEEMLAIALRAYSSTAPSCWMQASAFFTYPSRWAGSTSPSDRLTAFTA